MCQLLQVYFLLLDFLHLLLPLLLVDTGVPDAVQGDLDQHAFCLHDDVVLELALLVVYVVFVPLQVQVLISPELPRLGQEVGTSELLHPPFQNHD